MLIPAVAYKQEILSYSNILRYSKEMMMYNGCCEHGPMHIQEDWDCGMNYQWAIVNKDRKLIGYIAYKVDHYAHSVYSFGLIRFEDDKLAMTSGIVAAIKHILSMNPNRIEFRCVYDNSAKQGYDAIVSRFAKDYAINIYHLHDLFKDEQGKYHDEALYELLRLK